MAKPVSIPLLNQNEPEALLVALHVQEGQFVENGSLLYTLETTKSTTDVMAEDQGYVVGLRFQPGQKISAGETLCFLAETPDWISPETTPSPESQNSEDRLPIGLRITQPALALARTHKLDLGKLPTGPLVTESMVRASLGHIPGPDVIPLNTTFDPTSILIYGGGGHSKMVIDLLRGSHSFNIVGIVDDGRPAGDNVMGIPILGGKEILSKLYSQGIRLLINAVAGISNIATRIKIFQLVAEAGYTFPTIIHRTAFLEPGARLSAGVQVFANAYVGSEVKVGFGTIISTGVIISHDCVLGDYVVITPGSILAGEVEVGAGTLIGMGTTVNLGVKIGEGVRIGNSATIKQDVPSGSVIRAGTIWPR